MSIQLVNPTRTLHKSFLAFVNDVKETGYESYPHYQTAEIDFDSFLSELENASMGVDLPNDWAPCSSFWLVKDKQEVIGVIRIRHHVNSPELQAAGHIGYEIKSTHRKQGYGRQLLSLGLIEASHLGLKDVLITCAEDNLGSIKLIEQAGGQFVQQLEDPDDGYPVRQYHLQIKGNTP